MIPLLLALGCAPEPLSIQVVAVDSGVEVRASGPISRVEVLAEDGSPIVARSVPNPTAQVHVIAPLRSDRPHHVIVFGGGRRAEAELPARDAGPVSVAIEAPVGQGRREVRDGDVLTPAVVGPLRLAVHVTAREATTVPVRFGEDTREITLAVGERAVLYGDGSPIVVGDVRVRVEPRARTVADARALLRVVDTAFPTDPTGTVDRARPPDRVTLPAPWWRDGLRDLGLGYRPRGDQAPWAWQTVTLANDDTEPVSVVLRATVERRGAPHPAFRARLRDGVEDRVTALLRVPAGQSATAVLPVYVDAAALREGVSLERVIEVVPLGSDTPLHRIERPLFATVGSRWASAGFGAALLATASGYALLAVRGRRWLDRRTSELVTIALLASLTFVVGAAFQVLGTGLATVLGPFAPLVTGLPDHAFRACLLGTLVTLVPRPGVLAIATGVGFAMRGLALGSFHPVDLMYVGSAVFWLETWSWAAGITRVIGWVDEPRARRWVRLGLGLGLANVCATATALVLSVVLYRLYFAAWYVALILAVPGFLYVLVGCWIALDFAAALRRVEP